MELFEAIRRRHSYRGPFRDQPVPCADLERIVEAGIRAPSGRNAQTTSFVVVVDPELVRRIGGMHEKNRAMREARVFIACVIDSDPEPVYRGHSFQVEDCAAAVENILLAITALGYATVWIDGWLRVDRRREVIGSLLRLPAGKVVRVILPIGVPEQDLAQKEKKPFGERAWFNQYGG